MEIKQENISNQGASCTKKKKVKTREDDDNKSKSGKPSMEPGVKNQTSMSSLILWNVSQALELNPALDLKQALTEANQDLEKETRDLNTVLAKLPEQQHLVCAVLAWHELGHHDAEGLYNFIESKKNVKLTSNQCDDNLKQLKEDKPTSSHCCGGSSLSKCDAGSFGSHTSGPVLKLPVETKVIMRVANKARPSPPKERCKEKDPIMSKIDDACCLNTKCVEHLASLDSTIKEMRARACKLARREAERVELLERADAAWRDLELGYQRRLTLAEEKEDDINKQIDKIISERNEFKKACTNLSLQLKDRGDATDALKAKLTEVEKQVCDRAFVKMRLSEECKRGEALLAEQQCKVTQLDRDLQFKEEQARRRLITLENETESARALTFEAERALRAELSGLREQIKQVSNKLLQEDEENVRVKTEHDQLRQQKMNLIEDLDGCKLLCDRKMHGLVEELNKKKEELNGIKEHIMECRCKLPINVTVEVKRTPSLAALCRCTPEDKLLESCSCTSLRGRLLTNLLADLFGGLQNELSTSSVQMPCQLLKCLEDKHNWDRASVLKTNLRNFFSQLLMGELDIAIATSIENYHAKWIGQSCADIAKMVPDPDEDMSEGWQQRALEKKAEKMAVKLAEKLFEERAEQVAQQAKDIVMSEPPPCQCQPSPQTASGAAVFPVMMTSNQPFANPAFVNEQPTSEMPPYWKRTIQDVTQLKLQIEDLKKESLKKEDLKLMEDKITKIVKNASGNINIPTVSREISNHHEEIIKKREKKIMRPIEESVSPNPIQTNTNKIASKKRQIENINGLKKYSTNLRPNNKPIRQGGHGQSYAVNLCLCDEPQRNNKKLPNIHSDEKPTWRQKTSRDILPHSSSLRHTKPINVNLPTPNLNDNFSRSSAQPSCDSDCKCFHKMPSSTSIDKLLNTLTKWKCNLANPEEQCNKHVKSSFSKCSKNGIKDSMRISHHHDSKINMSMSKVTRKEQATESDICNEFLKDFQPAYLKHMVAPTESEYIGAMNLDKSNEKACKCINKVEDTLEYNQPKTDSGINCIPIKCINTSPCDCKLFQDMQKDTKRSQTEDLTKFDLLNQVHGIHSNNINKVSISSHNNQTEIEQISEKSSIEKETELFSRSCEIKFLGVTLGDVDSHKVMKIDLNTDAVLHSKEKCLNRKRKHSKNILADTEINNATIDGKIKHYNNPCECHARFDELKNFINSVFSKQITNSTISHKDVSNDPPNFKVIGSCECFKSLTIHDSKDLELNTFHLLEEHLKEKLKQFKLNSCKSSCITPDEEEKLFSAILKRVKQVISDCANEMKCGCPNNLSSDGSWNRAYGLLQEYLKIKIKRVQRFCVMSEKKDKNMIPEILEKVCNLIENDFQRLKNICKCKSNFETQRINKPLDDFLQTKTETPEKDTNVIKFKEIDNSKLSVVEKFTKQNSNKSLILKENISSQVPQDVGKITKSCEVTSLCNKDTKTTETDCNTRDFNCSYNAAQEGITQYSEKFISKEVLVSIYTNTFRDTDVMCNLPSGLSADRFAVEKTVANIEKNSDPNKQTEIRNDFKEECDNKPSYIGYTVHCTCDRSLGPCNCTKSAVLANNDKIVSIWREALSNSKIGKKQFSYIMSGPQKIHSPFKNIYIPKESDDSPSNTRTCETDANDIYCDDIVLKHSSIYKYHPVHTIHDTTSTFDENASYGTSCSTNEMSHLDWSCPVPFNCVEKSSTVKLSNSVCYPFPTKDTMDYPQCRQPCECNKVPLCHVKMLVENIEKNLMESNCTCDAISKVCPIHSKKP